MSAIAVNLLTILPARAQTNVALNKQVTLVGNFGLVKGNGPALAPASSLVDGVFLARGNPFEFGTVYWENAPGFSTENNILINLQGRFLIDSFVVQADDNDAYILEYRDGSSALWSLAWDIPVSVISGGMRVRPNDNDFGERYFLSAPVTATELRFRANISQSDFGNSVSEIQAFGVAVAAPEPGTFSLILCGIGSVFASRQRRIKAREIARDSLFSRV